MAEVGMQSRAEEPHRSANSTPSFHTVWDGRMRDIDTALSHDLDQITIAELVSDVPSDTENDNCAVEVAAMK